MNTNNGASDKAYLKAIAPRKGDPARAKYSPNLHKWLVYNRAELRQFTVYSTPEQMWIGYEDDGWFMGTPLIQVLCQGSSKQLYATSLSNFKERHAPLEPISNFWEEYLARGRCAIDKKHAMPFLNDQTRWEYSGTMRSCCWCGNCVQELHKWTETISREAWRNRNQNEQN